MRAAPFAALFALAAVTLGACTLGPNFRSPDAPATDRYLDTLSASGFGDVRAAYGD